MGRWISQAELSTCSRSPRLLPRSVYLSHQFSFHALGEDYHALLRRFSFDLPATKIDVRREVAISAYPSGGTETFLQSGSAPRDIRGGGSGGNASFEEPLSSALAADLDYPGTSSAVLPMFPNGTPSSHRASAYAPIRHMAAGLGEGVTEGIGRLRRGVGRTRSARSGANDNTLRGESSGSPAVPLEFEDDDEDFLSVGGRGGDDSAQHDDDGLSLGTGTSAGDRSAGGTAPPTTPPSAHGALPQVEGTGDEAWAGWDTQDAQAIEDAERFDDIVVGYMDEDQHRPPPPLPVKSLSGSKKKKAKK